MIEDNIPAIVVEEDQITILDPLKLITEAEEKRRRGGRPTDEVRLAQGKRRIKPQNGWWPEEKKVEVATLHQAGLRSLGDLQKLTGVPAETIKTWRKQEWWLELLDKINTETDQDTVSKFNEIIDKALDQVQDRILNGDFYVEKRTGDIKRKPASLKDMTVATAVIVDKRQLLRGKATSRVEKVEINDRLNKLAAEFRRFVEAKDVTPVSVLDNEVSKQEVL